MAVVQVNGRERIGELHQLLACAVHKVSLQDEYVRIIKMMMLVKRNCSNTDSCLATLLWAHMFKVFLFLFFNSTFAFRDPSDVAAARSDQDTSIHPFILSALTVSTRAPQTRASGQGSLRKSQEFD